MKNVSTVFLAYVMMTFKYNKTGFNVLWVDALTESNNY